MKKFLSLVLALVMTMSLVTISAGAKDFTDDSKINYEEAVDVMSAVKVIDGYADGSFNPQGSLTRGAAAKIICNLILGPTTAAALSADTAPYKDVPVNHTFAGYIAYCQQQGIISGYADGTFRPAATLTNYAFLKMLLGALGYDSNIEGYVGDNWSIAVAKRALNIGLTKGLDGTLVGTDYATREQACLYALNTLKATMVDYDAKITANVNGATVIVGNSVAEDVEWNIAEAKNDGNIKDDGYVQFAEKYFTNLELEIGNGIYGRPANIWKLKKSEIGAYTSIEPTYVYTEATENQDVYKDLGKAVIDQTVKEADRYDWTAFINGKEVDDEDDIKYPINKDDGNRDKDDDYEYTANGTVTEIYVDDDAQTVTVCEINNYLGQVTRVKDGVITVKVLSKGATLNEKTFEVEGFEEDDYVVFTTDYNDDDDYVIGEVFEPETASGEVTAVENDKDAASGKKKTGTSYLELDDGEKYTYSEGADAAQTQQKHMVYDLDGTLNSKVHPELKEEYVLYLDPNGYVLGFKVVDGETKYLYVDDSDEELKDWVAKVYLTDGTKVKVDLKSKFKDSNKQEQKIEWVDGNNGTVPSTTGVTNVDKKIWKYTASDAGVYSLSYVKNETLDDAEINNGRAYVSDGKNQFIVDKKTIFVDVDGERAFVGYNEVPDVENAELAYVLDGKVAEVVFILEGDFYDDASMYFMLLKDTRKSFKYDGDYYWAYSKAYVDGGSQTVNVGYDAVTEAGLDALDAGVLYKAVKTIEDGEYVTKLEVKALSNNEVTAVGDDAFWITGVKTKEVKYDVNDETKFVLVEYDEKGKLDTISDGDINDMFEGKDDDGFMTYVTVVEADDETAELVYIVYKKAVVMHTVSFTGADLDSVKVEDGKSVEIPYAPEGYTVTVAGTGASYADGKITVKDVTADVTVTVTLTAGARTVTTVGEVTADKTSIAVDTEGTVKLTAKTGYTITSVAGGSAWTLNNDGTVSVTIAAGKGDVTLTVTTAEIAYDVEDGTTNDYTVAGNAASAEIGDTLTFTVTAENAGAAANGKAVKLNGVKVGELAGGADKVEAKYEFVQVVSTEAAFNAVKDAAGTVYDKDGNAIDSYTTGDVALYKMTADEVAAVAATASVSAVITEDMLVGNAAAITITVE